MKILLTGILTLTLFVLIFINIHGNTPYASDNENPPAGAPSYNFVL